MIQREPLIGFKLTPARHPTISDVFTTEIHTGPYRLETIFI